LKVQLVDGTPTPIFIEGFSWENGVPQPPGWPVAGSFSFYKATMLDIEPYGVGELFNVNGGITHNDTGIQHQVVIAHYRGTSILDYHTASSQIVGVEDSLLAQSLQNAEVGDYFYFAISPDVGDLSHFNYNLGSLKQHPCFTFGPGFQGMTFPSGLSYAKVTADSLSLEVIAAGGGGGGGAGQATTNNGTTSIGKGGGGGGGGSFFSNCPDIVIPPGPKEPLIVVKDDVLKIFAGPGGAGGSPHTGANANGMDGSPSFISLKPAGSNTFDFIGPTGFVGTNPILGGQGGIGGTGGGDGGTGGQSTGSAANGGGGGGGGGANLIDGVPGAPGLGGTGGSPLSPGEDGGINPRNGGTGGFLGPPPVGGGGICGGQGGFATGPSSGMGSGGGGGGSSSEGPGGSGGNGGLGDGSPGGAGLEADTGNGGGGGGGGSGGLGAPGSYVLGGKGGNGAFGGIIISPFPS